MTQAIPRDFVRAAPSPVLPPPAFTQGPLAWMGANLFSGVTSTILTFASLALFVWAVPGLVQFLFLDAVWSAADGVPCRALQAGACWAYIGEKLPYFIYGSYPRDAVWRVDIVLVTGALLIGWLLWLAAPHKGLAALLFFVVYPVASYVLLSGAPALGLARVPTDLWGGVFVSLLVSVVGIVVSLPGGVLLALGRRSRLPVVKFVSVAFIEFVRGVPLITVLFMANLMLPLFVPAALTPDRLVRPLIGVSLFASAYMAEVVRGGLQAMPKGQFEGAMAIGLSYWNMMRLVILPQALTIVIPEIGRAHV